MHDVQPINGVVNGGVLLKRLTHHHQQQQQQQQQQQVGHHLLLQPQQQQQQQQALKCPRCDSLNTKFCYYNNYNLSQPRYFCKNCRRYWTKGGILRNVPVGGGCRKSKRSSSSSVSSKHKSSSSSKKNNNDIIIQNTNSSSESSSTNTAVGGGGDGGGGLFQIPEVENHGMTSDLEPLVDSTTSNLFSGEIRGFMNLISNKNKNSNDSNFGVVANDGIVNGNVSSAAAAAAAASFTEFLQNQGVHDWDMGKICGVHQQDEKIGGTSSIDLVDPAVTIDDLLQNRGSTVGLTSLDWHLTAGNSSSNNNQGNFDVTDNSSVDHQAYWSQSSTSAAHDNSQWSDSTTSHLPLFLP